MGCRPQRGRSGVVSTSQSTRSPSRCLIRGRYQSQHSYYNNPKNPSQGRLKIIFGKEQLNWVIQILPILSRALIIMSTTPWQSATRLDDIPWGGLGSVRIFAHFVANASLCLNSDRIKRATVCDKVSPSILRCGCFKQASLIEMRWQVCWYIFAFDLDRNLDYIVMQISGSKG